MKLIMNKNIKLGFFTKLCLSIFPILVTILFLDIIVFEYIPFAIFEKIWLALFVLMIFQTVFLIFLISKRKFKLENKIIYIILNLSIPIFQLYYIWVLDNKSITS